MRRSAGGRWLAVALVCGTCATVTGAAGAVSRSSRAAVAPIDPATYSFLTAPTDQLGVPGYQAGSELTPQAGIYTGDGEVDWRVGSDAAPLPVLGRTLLDGRSPIDVLSLTRGGIRYALTVLCAPVGGEPVDFVEVAMTDVVAHRAAARWGSVLSFSGGAPEVGGVPAFRFAPLIGDDPAWTYARSGRAMTRSGQVMELVPPGGASSSAGAGVSYARTLAPGGSWKLDFAVPVVPIGLGSAAETALAQASFPQQLAAQERFWHRFFAGAMQVSLPEAKVSDSFDASLAIMEQSRYPASSGAGWVQTPNKLQYNAFFIRDAAFIVRAFDVAGLHAIAGQDLDYFPSVQQPDGLFESQPDQLDGVGEALWSMGQHAQWPGESAWARRMLPSAAAGVAWLAAACASDPAGLVPTSSIDDNEMASGYITGDDFLAADGLQGAVALARVAGQPALAAAWQRQLDGFEVHLHAALSAAEALTGGWIPPTLSNGGGLTWGNLWASYPSEVTLSPEAPAVSATLAHVSATFSQGIATYAGMLHDYLGYRVFETELQRGDSAAVVAGLYAELAHTDATDGGFETDLLPGHSRALISNLAPHGWFAAEYVTLLANMLVEEVGPAAVQIMSAISPDWIQPGRVIAVTGAPTDDGTVSYRLVSFAGGARLSWVSALRPGVALRWRLPAASGQHRVLTLDGPRGALTVHWRLRGPVPSFATTAAAVLAQARG